MASNKYRNAAARLTTTAATTLYTCPEGTVALVNGLVVGNVDAAAQAVALEWVDQSAAVTLSLGSALSVAAGGRLQVLDRPLVLEGGDALKATAAAANVLHVTASLLEVVSPETAT